LLRIDEDQDLDFVLKNRGGFLNLLRNKKNFCVDPATDAP
jgi:hypothetical protein